MFREEAVTVGADLVRRCPESDKFRTSLAAYRYALALEYADRGNTRKAEELYRDSFEESQHLMAKYPADSVRYGYYATARRGHALLRLTNPQNPARYLEEVNALLQTGEEIPKDRANWSAFVEPFLQNYWEAAEVLERLGRQDAAVAMHARGVRLLQDISDRNPSDCSARRSAAVGRHEQGQRRWASDPDGAGREFRLTRGLFDSLILDFPQDSHVWMLYATFLATCPDPNIRNLSRAEKYAKEAVARNPKDADAQGVLGICLCEAGKYAEAHKELKGCLERGGGRAEGVGYALYRCYLAQARWGLGDRDGAKGELRKVSAVLHGEWLVSWEIWAAPDRSWRLIEGTDPPSRRKEAACGLKKQGIPEGTCGTVPGNGREKKVRSGDAGWILTLLSVCLDNANRLGKCGEVTL